MSCEVAGSPVTLLAALVLVVSQPRLWRAALIQGAAPLLALLAFALAMLG